MVSRKDLEGDIHDLFQSIILDFICTDKGNPQETPDRTAGT